MPLTITFLASGSFYQNSIKKYHTYFQGLLAYRLTSLKKTQESNLASVRGYIMMAYTVKSYHESGSLLSRTVSLVTV